MDNDRLVFTSLTGESITLHLQLIAPGNNPGELNIDSDPTQGIGSDRPDIIEFFKTHFAFSIQGSVLAMGQYFRVLALSINQDMTHVWVAEIDEQIEREPNYDHWVKSVKILLDKPERSPKETILLCRLQQKIDRYNALSQSLKADILGHVKPGAKPGQVILAVDLSIAGDVTQSLDKLRQLGYAPDLRHVSYPAGVHVLAILKDETAQSDEHLLPEWKALLERFPSEAVHLWSSSARFHQKQVVSMSEKSDSVSEVTEQIKAQIQQLATFQMQLGNATAANSVHLSSLLLDTAHRPTEASIRAIVAEALDPIAAKLDALCEKVDQIGDSLERITQKRPDDSETLSE